MAAKGEHHKKAKALFVRTGQNGIYRENVKKASPAGYLTSGHNNAHHIVCQSCVQEASIYVEGVDEEFVRNCLLVTDWNVNNPKNLIGLPMKSAYFLKADEFAKWDKLPCHQMDHNPDYVEAVDTWLHDNIWNMIKETEVDCEKIPAGSLAELLDWASDHWRSFLLERGASHEGTKACWDGRFLGKAAVWWIPFSMHPGPVIPARACPADDFKWTGHPSLVLFRATIT